MVVAAVNAMHEGDEIRAVGEAQAHILGIESDRAVDALSVAQCRDPSASLSIRRRGTRPPALPPAIWGRFPPALVADWIAECFRGRSFPSERWLVDSSGRITKTPL
jgi:hypothetical protein